MSAIAGGLVLSGCGKDENADFVKAVSRTGREFYIVARSSDQRCQVSMHDALPRNYFGSLNMPSMWEQGPVFLKDIISNPNTVKTLLEGNEASLKLAMEKGECKPGDKVMILMEQAMAELRRQ